MANTTKSGGKTGTKSAKQTSSGKASVPDIGKTGQAKKQTAPKKTSSKQTEKEVKEQNEKTVAARRHKLAIIFFAAAAVLLFIAFIKGESGWLAMHNFFFRLFGSCMYVLPLIFAYLGIIYEKNRSIGSASANLAGSGLFVTMACMLIHILRNVGNIVTEGEFAGKKYLSSIPVTQQVSDVWSCAEPNRTGGVLGALLGGGVSKLMGPTGSIILLVIALIVVVMFVGGITVSGVFTSVSKPVKKVGEMTNERFERTAELHEQRMLERAENKEKKKFNPPEQKQKEKQPKPEKKPDIDVVKTEDVPPTFDDSFVRDESTFKIRGAGGDTKEIGMEIPVVDVDAEAAAAADSAAMPVIMEKRRRTAPKKPEAEAPVKEDTAPKTEEKPAAVPHITGYQKPPVDLLSIHDNAGIGDSSEEMNAVAGKLISTLDSFNVKARIVDICSGPSVTRYEVEPDEGVRISRITKLADDIALRLASSGVRIAAIPNKTAIGIEVPNRTRETVGMRECIDTEQFRRSKSKLNVALGKDIAGNIIYADLAKMPHLLIAGTTGSGKSVCLNTMIISILYNASPEDVKIVLIDPKQVEFTVYNGIAHLEVPVVSNPRKAAGALGWAVAEMEKRYQKFAENNVRDISGYNKLAETKDSMEKMHQVVIFIDELSDLMMVAPNEVEDSICRLAQMARAAGMHLVVATQRPSVNVITGVIKANIPSRIALSVSSQVDSRTILDQSGAEKLLGNGDMLFAPIGSSKPQRLQGCFISDGEVENIVEFVKQNSQASYNDDVIKQIDNLAAASENAKKKGSGSVSFDDESESSGPSEDVIKALEVLIKAGKASTTFLQNKLGWGYPKAARVMSELEDCNYIAPKEGNKERRVLITMQQFYELSSSNSGIPPVNTMADEEPDNEEDEEDIPFVNYDESIYRDDDNDVPFDEDEDMEANYISFDDSED